MYEDIPIYESLFEMEMSLAERFPSMTPLTLRREKAREVFLLLSRFKLYAKRQNKAKNGARIIRKPAGDNWF